MNGLPNELEAFLTDPDGERASAVFRRNLLDQTESLLPNPGPRRHRQFLAAAACGPLLLGVLLFFGIWWILRRGAVWNDVALVDPVAVVPAIVEAPVLAPVPAPSEPTFSPALTLEWRAFDSAPANQAKLYWSAGQSYVAAEGDYLSAIRCYRQALESGPAEMRQITDEDDLLAMALKLDRNPKEK